MEQYYRRRQNAYIDTFELLAWDGLKNEKNFQSFLLTLYTDMYVQLSKKWHIEKPILDYNLARLQQCALQNGFQFSINDLPLALEFYLQTDVDFFHLKTCAFRRGQPRVIVDNHGQRTNEGIFTMDRQFIEGRYGLMTCDDNSCFCCKNQSGFVQFSLKQIHHFLNHYQAILNCPVVSVLFRSIVYYYRAIIICRNVPHLILSMY